MTPERYKLVVHQDDSVTLIGQTYGRSETFKTRGPTDPRIVEAVAWCHVAGYHVKIEFEK